MRFFYVYVLKSRKHDFVYVGFTKDLRNRFNRHNNLEEKSTKYFAPFDVIHYEAYRNQKGREEKGRISENYKRKDYFEIDAPRVF